MFTRAAALALSALVVPTAIAVPSIAIAQEQNGYSRLVEAVANDRFSGMIFERDMAVGFEGVLRQDADTKAIEDECPGYIKGMGDAVRPIMRISHDYDYAWYRVELEKLIRQDMTEAEASSAADLFGSELGQRFLGTAITNYSVDNSISDVLSNDDFSVSAESLESDRQETAQRLLRALDPEDLAAFSMQLMQSEWIGAFQILQPKINQLQLQLANRDFTPEHGAEFDKVVNGFVNDHLDKCQSRSKK